MILYSGGKGKDFMEMMGGTDANMPNMLGNMSKPSGELMGKPNMEKPSKGEMMEEKEGLCLSEDQVATNFQIVLI